MKNIWTHFAMAAITAILFLIMLQLNMWLFSWLEFTAGVNWIYLPAGVRMLCTLLFAEAGAVGLLAVSWFVCFYYFFPDNWARSFTGGIVATLAPYGTFCIARHWLGLGSSLSQLTPTRLLALSAIYAFANALLHAGLNLVLGDGVQLGQFFVMMVGDFNGTLIVLYAFKALLMLPAKVNRYELK
ncbi:hypothetical protein KUF54_03535 [Comamonas sp. Y33R10-2]|nr:hypothetical protein KUF54_03535 [Comamonas sp. Y33R10-2]